MRRVSKYSIQIRWALFITVPLLFNACMLGGPKTIGYTPDWILNHPREYPSELYLVGVGSAPTSVGLSLALGAATSSARAELVQTIEVHINHSQKMTNQSQSLERTNAGQVQLALDMERSEVSSFTSSSAEHIVQGIEIKEKYHDKEDEILYVLAVLEKEAAAERISKEISEINRDLEAEISKAEEYVEQEDLLMSIRHYREAYRKSSQIESLRKQLSVLSLADLDTKTQPSDGIAIWLIELLQQYRVNVVMVDDTAQVLETIQDVLAKSGFSANVNQDKTAPGVTLWAKTNIQWDTYKGKYAVKELQVCRIYLNIQLIDHMSGTIIGQVNMVENSNAESKDRAQQRALRLLNKQILTELPSAIFRVLSIEVKT